MLFINNRLDVLSNYMIYSMRMSEDHRLPHDHVRRVHIRGMSIYSLKTKN